MQPKKASGQHPWRRGYGVEGLGGVWKKLLWGWMGMGGSKDEIVFQVGLPPQSVGDGMYRCTEWVMEVGSSQNHLYKHVTQDSPCHSLS